MHGRGVSDYPGSTAVDGSSMQMAELFMNGTGWAAGQRQAKLRGKEQTQSGRQWVGPSGPQGPCEGRAWGRGGRHLDGRMMCWYLEMVKSVTEGAGSQPQD